MINPTDKLILLIKKTEKSINKIMPQVTIIFLP